MGHFLLSLAVVCYNEYKKNNSTKQIEEIGMVWFKKYKNKRSRESNRLDASLYLIFK